MSATKAPSVEAMQAIVARINSATVFTLQTPARYVDQLSDELETPSLQIDVTSEDEEQLNETLATEDYTSHQVRVWIRKKVSTPDHGQIDLLKLLTRQVFQRLNQFATDDQRVRVWECDYDPAEVPIKEFLREYRMFVASVLMRVEVKAS